MSLTDQRLIEVIRSILMRQEKGDWISAKYLYAQLVAHPGRFGVDSIYDAPKLDRFINMCQTMFKTRKAEGEIEVKVDWKGYE